MIKKIIAMEKYFWKVNVIGGIEPIPDGSEATTNYFNRKYSSSNRETVELSIEILSQHIKQLENAKNATANLLKSHLKEAEVGTISDKKVKLHV